MKRSQGNNLKNPVVFSKHFPDGFGKVDDLCFTTWSHYSDLKKRYHALFLRYKRETERLKK